MVIRAVVLSAAVEREFERGKVPVQVERKLRVWQQDVEARGLDEVRKIPGYHDEPLLGDRLGQRSIRLNKQWRAIYEIHGAVVQFVAVVEVTPHKY